MSSLPSASPHRSKPLDTAQSLLHLRQVVDQQRVQMEAERDAALMAAVGDHQEKERALQQQLMQARAALESMDKKSLSEASSPLSCTRCIM
jgi:hypothetical protein